MSEIELTRGEEDSCRQKAIDSVQAFVKSFPSDVTNEQAMERLTDLFAKTARCVKACAENFEPAEFIARGHHAVTPHEELRTIMKGNLIGTYKLEALRDEMGRNPLSRVNGTSVKFRECAGLVEQRMESINVEKLVMTTKCTDKSLQNSVRSALTDLTCKIGQFLTGMLFLADLSSAV